MPLMKMRWVACALVAGIGGVGLPASASAADGPTYYENVAAIFQANCVSCHQPAGANLGGLLAPMSLATFEEVRPWTRAIARKVKAREMPPWFADEPKGVFLNERGLTDREIDTIVAWVDAGAPGGDKSKAPSAAVQPTSAEYLLGKPDLVVKMNPYFVADDAQDLQGTLTYRIPETLVDRDIPIQAWEIRTGTSSKGAESAVHHICGGLRLPGEAADDVADGEGGGSMSLGCIAGGAEPTMLPAGYGMELKKGASITMNMHYYKQAGPGTGFTNQPEVAFYFAKGPVKHRVRSTAIGTQSFQIPPHAVGHRVGTSLTLAKDTVILALWPHGHLRATGARYVAYYPDGREEVLLNVPRYDQSWQVTYKYREPKVLPKGTRIEYEMRFDNSIERGSKRHFNPNLPVWYGPRTQDEMVLGFMSFAELEETPAASPVAGQP
jgi:mono/diheme cytochrome c family protein